MNVKNMGHEVKTEEFHTKLAVNKQNIAKMAALEELRLEKR